MISDWPIREGLLALVRKWASEDFARRWQLYAAGALQKVPTLPAALR